MADNTRKTSNVIHEVDGLKVLIGNIQVNDSAIKLSTSKGLTVTQDGNTSTNNDQPTEWKLEADTDYLNRTLNFAKSDEIPSVYVKDIKSGDVTTLTVTDDGNGVYTLTAIGGGGGGGLGNITISEGKCIKIDSEQYDEDGETKTRLTINADIDCLETELDFAKTTDIGNGGIALKSTDGSVTINGQNATANQSVNTSWDLSVKTSTPTEPGDGAIKLSGGTGIDVTGANGTANQKTDSSQIISIDSTVALKTDIPTIPPIPSVPDNIVETLNTLDGNLTLESSDSTIGIALNGTDKINLTLNASLENLLDVSDANPSDKQILTWNDGDKKWEPAASQSGGVTTLAALDDTNVVTPEAGQTLVWNNTDSKWENKAAIGDGKITLTEGNGIKVTGDNATANQAGDTSWAVTTDNDYLNTTLDFAKKSDIHLPISDKDGTVKIWSAANDYINFDTGGTNDFKMDPDGNFTANGKFISKSVGITDIAFSNDDDDGFAFVTKDYPGIVSNGEQVQNYNYQVLAENPSGQIYQRYQSTVKARKGPTSYAELMFLSDSPTNMGLRFLSCGMDVEDVVGWPENCGYDSSGVSAILYTGYEFLEGGRSGEYSPLIVGSTNNADVCFIQNSYPFITLDADQNDIAFHVPVESVDVKTELKVNTIKGRVDDDPLIALGTDIRVYFDPNTDNNEVFTILHTQRVGVNTAAPLGQFHVSGEECSLVIQKDGKSAWFQQALDDDLVIGTLNSYDATLPTVNNWLKITGAGDLVASYETPATDNSLATKKYVDDSISSGGNVDEDTVPGTGANFRWNEKLISVPYSINGEVQPVRQIFRTLYAYDGIFTDGLHWTSDGYNWYTSDQSEYAPLLEAGLTNDLGRVCKGNGNEYVVCQYISNDMKSWRRITGPAGAGIIYLAGEVYHSDCRYILNRAASLWESTGFSAAVGGSLTSSPNVRVACMESGLYAVVLSVIDGTAHWTVNLDGEPVPYQAIGNGITGGLSICFSERLQKWMIASDDTFWISDDANVSATNWTSMSLPTASNWDRMVDDGGTISLASTDDNANIVLYCQAPDGPAVTADWQTTTNYNNRGYRGFTGTNGRTIGSMKDEGRRTDTDTGDTYDDYYYAVSGDIRTDNAVDTSQIVLVSPTRDLRDLNPPAGLQTQSDANQFMAAEIAKRAPVVTISQDDWDALAPEEIDPDTLYLIF